MKEPSSEWTQEERISIACMIALTLKGEAQVAPVRRETIVAYTTSISAVLTKPKDWLENNREQLLDGLEFKEE